MQEAPLTDRAEHSEGGGKGGLRQVPRGGEVFPEP